MKQEQAVDPTIATQKAGQQEAGPQEVAQQEVAPRRLFFDQAAPSQNVPRQAVPPADPVTLGAGLRLVYGGMDRYVVNGPVTTSRYSFVRDKTTLVDISDVEGLLALTITIAGCCGAPARSVVHLLQEG